MKARLILVIIVLLLICIQGLFGQSRMRGDDVAPTPSPSAIPSVEGLSSLKAFRGIEIGMAIEQVKELIGKDPYFNYRGDPDVYFLPMKEQTLIECSGNGFIKRAFFQFVEKKLFVMIIDLNEYRVDYFSLLTTLTKNYGEYLLFTPQAVVWEKKNIRLSLEKPLTVKYIDVDVFNRLKSEGKAVETQEEKVLLDFLLEF